MRGLIRPPPAGRSARPPAGSPPRRPGSAPRRASRATAPIRCASRSSATCTSTPASRPTPTSREPASDRATRTTSRGAGRAPAGRRRRSPDAPVASHRSSARLRRRHRPRRVLRRGRSVLDRGLAGVRRPAVRHPAPARAGPEQPVRGHGRLALPRRHPEPAAVARLLLAARRRLRRRRGVGLAGDPGRGRGGLRSHRGVHLHQLHRLRAHHQPDRPPPAPQRHLPQRPRAGVRGQPSRDRRRRPAAGPLVGDRDPLPQRRHRLRRADHPAQLEPERRAAVRRPGRRRRGAAPPDLEPLVEIHQQKGNSECRFDRLAGHRRRHRRRAVHLRAASPGARGSRRGAAADRRATRCATWCATR